VDEPGQDGTVLVDLRREFLNHLLAQSGAVSLSCGNEPPEAFRFVWMESNRAAIVVLVFREGTSWQARSTIFNDPRTTDDLRSPPRVVATSLVAVPDSQVDEIKKSIVRSQLWTVAVSERRLVDDGASWVLEARQRNAYGAIVQVNSQDRLILAVGALLMQAAGVEVPPELVERLAREQ